LQPQTDAKKRPPGGDRLFDRIVQPACAKLAHGIAHGADAGQNHLVGAGDRLGPVADFGGVAHFFKRFLHAAEVAHAVVDNGDHASGAPGGERENWRAQKGRGRDNSGVGRVRRL
jgi:hypothetical protein